MARYPRRHILPVVPGTRQTGAGTAGHRTLDRAARQPRLGRLTDEESRRGHSIGRWEDGVLVIHTEKFAAGILTESTLHTDQMALEERLSITPDRGHLLISWIANDPEYYAEPLTGSQELQPTSQDIIRYECIPGAPSGYPQ